MVMVSLLVAAVVAHSKRSVHRTHHPNPQELVSLSEEVLAGSVRRDRQRHWTTAMSVVRQVLEQKRKVIEWIA